MLYNEDKRVLGWSDSGTAVPSIQKILVNTWAALQFQNGQKVVLAEFHITSGGLAL